MIGHIKCKIIGIPYSRNKTRGNAKAPGEWTEAVIQQTRDLPKVKGPAILHITFFLLPDKFPLDLPHGPDLDNLTKRFFDALNKTIFSEVAGHDSCVIEMNVKKIKVDHGSESGVLLEVLPMSK